LFLTPIALALLIGAIVNLVRNFGWSAGFHTLAAIWAVVATFKIRLYSLKVQDRVIRLEEQVRLKEILSDPLRSRIAELNEDQLVGLRFASDGEVAVLVEKTLTGKLGRKEIKQSIRVWRPDYWRV
jgi:hypothetical protein